MDKSRTVCKERIAHHYWHRMDDRKRFFKIMMGDFKNRVIIPEKFVVNLRGKISEEVKLEMPDGKTYAVQVAKEQNKLVLQSGWADFASAYELKCGELLVFRNIENSHFKVRVFDPSGCEKQLPCALMDRAPCVQERKVSHGNHMQLPTGKRMEIGSPISSRKTSKTKPMDSPSREKAEHVLSSEDIQEPMGPSGFQKVTMSGFMISDQRAKVHANQTQSPTGRRIEIGSPSGSRKTLKIRPTDSPSKDKAEHLPSSESIHEPMRSCGFNKPIKSCIVSPTGFNMTSDQRAKVHANQTQSPNGKRIEIGSPCGSRKTSKTRTMDSPSKKKAEHVPSSESIQDPMRSSGSNKPTKSYIVVPTGFNMTSEQRAKIIALEQKIQPKIPFHVTAMHRKNVASGILVFSKNYAMKHLKNENGTIQLSRLDGSKSWTINLEITTDRRFAVSTGWMDFIQDNKLQEGDICVFRPSKSKNGVALIFHPLEESCRLQPPGYFTCKSSRHGVPKPPYMFPRGTILNDEQKTRVEEKVRAIQSEIPIYMAVIKNTNVNRRLGILVFGWEYAGKYLPHMDQTVRLRRLDHIKDHTWKAELRVKKRTQRHSLVRGWMQFVNDNKLKLGDICLFHLVKNTKKLTMNVHIIRKRSV